METVGSYNVPSESGWLNNLTERGENIDYPCMPSTAMEATGSAPMVPTLPGTTSFTAQTGEDEDEMPPPEHGNLGQHPMPFGPGTADTGPVPWPANDMPFPPFPQNANSFETPFASAPLTGALASELHQLQQSTSDYTAQDLEDMPDMESPSVPVHQSLLMEESVSALYGHIVLPIDMTFPPRTGALNRRTRKWRRIRRTTKMMREVKRKITRMRL